MTSPPLHHRYFVSYAARAGFGCTEINLTLPIRGIDDVKLVSDLLAKQVGGTPIVLYFALLGTDGGARPSTKTTET